MQCSGLSPLSVLGSWVSIPGWGTSILQAAPPTKKHIYIYIYIIETIKEGL